MRAIILDGLEPRLSANEELYPKYRFHKKLIFQKSNFDNLDLLNITFLKCYLEDDTTSKSYSTLVNSSNVDYSRYLFFYSNYLINQNKVEEAKKLFLKQDKLTSGLLILQTNDWLKNNQTKNYCKIKYNWS